MLFESDFFIHEIAKYFRFRPGSKQYDHQSFINLKLINRKFNRLIESQDNKWHTFFQIVKKYSRKYSKNISNEKICLMIPAAERYFKFERGRGQYRIEYLAIVLETGILLITSTYNWKDSAVETDDYVKIYYINNKVNNLAFLYYFDIIKCIEELSKINKPNIDKYIGGFAKLIELLRSFAANGLYDLSLVINDMEKLFNLT